MATAPNVHHVFTQLNKLSKPKTKHAGEQTSTRAARDPERTVSPDESEGARNVFSFPAAAQRFVIGRPLAMGKLALPRCAVRIPTPGERVSVPSRGGGRAREGEAVFPPLPPYACYPLETKARTT